MFPRPTPYPSRPTIPPHSKIKWLHRFALSPIFYFYFGIKFRDRRQLAKRPSFTILCLSFSSLRKKSPREEFNIKIFLCLDFTTMNIDNGDQCYSHSLLPFFISSFMFLLRFATNQKKFQDVLNGNFWSVIDKLRAEIFIYFYDARNNTTRALTIRAKQIKIKGLAGRFPEVDLEPETLHGRSSTPFYMNA